MGLYTASLSSGSNGNCYYIGNSHEAVLIDMGISCQEIEKRLIRLQLPIQKIKAIFITHEHTDHIRGLVKFIKKHRVVVYINTATRQSAALKWSEGIAVNFQAYSPIQIGNLIVTAIPKFHDAQHPHSFLISGENVTIGVFTDSGRICDHLINGFKTCHAAFLESNYDEQMLETGQYTPVLKKRITGGYGHLSNKQARELFSTHRPDFMTHLFLAHLSKNNNNPEIVKKLFDTISTSTQIHVLPREKETGVYHIFQPERAIKDYVTNARLTTE